MAVSLASARSIASAVIGAELLLNAPLFDAPNELAILLAIRDGRVDGLEAATDLPEKLSAIVRHALAASPELRPDNASAMARES